jgi:hypothetical protein
LEKNRKKKPDVTWLIRRVDPVTWQDPVKNSVATVDFYFIFLLKRHHFDFLKKLT